MEIIKSLVLTHPAKKIVTFVSCVEPESYFKYYYSVVFSKSLDILTMSFKLRNENDSMCLEF